MKKYVLSSGVMTALICPLIVQAATFDASVSAGLGYDTNAYRSPSSPYMDYSVIVPVNVTPEEQSGFFIPLGIDASINHKLSRAWKLKSAYSFDGSKYLDSAQENADQYDHMLRLGGQYTLTNTNLRSSHLYAGLRLRDHKQTYADRDSGDEKVTSLGAVNVSDLYSYNAPGYELGYDYRKNNNWNVEIMYRQEDRNYSTPPPNSSAEQDHTYSKLAVTLGVDMSSKWAIDLDTALFTRDYDFRHAHNADGSFSTIMLTYDYIDMGLKLKQEVSKALKLSYGYSILQRTDNNVGYNDYDLSEFTLGVRYAVNNRVDIKGKIAVWTQTYPNAYNFDVPAQGEKSADGTKLQGRVTYEHSKTQDWWLDTELVSNNNTDNRYNYDRNMLMAGATWKF